MSLVQSKQIKKLLQAPIYLTGVAFAAGASIDIAALLAVAVGSAGDNGSSVPMQASSATTEGFIVTGNNKVNVWSTATGEKIKDASENEVYGRLTNAGAVYTLSLYTLVNGVETAYTSAATTYDIAVAYQFEFKNYPRDAAVGLDGRYVYADPKAAANGARFERLPVTGLNALTAFASAPNTSRLIELIVNGQVFTNADSPAPFSVVGTAITWSATNAGFDLATTDQVIATYSV